jgi:multiple sugar transport system substrate-binding protein
VRRFALLTACVLLTTACLRGSSPQQQRPNEIVWTVAGSDLAVHEQTRDRWNALHPDHPVRMQRLPDSADLQRIQLGLELNAKGDNFDVLSLDIIWTGEFAEYGWIESLDDLRPEAEQKIFAGPLKTGLYQQTLWAMPYTSTAGLLYYRKDLITTPPKTWEEAVRMGMAAGKQAGIAPYVGQGAAYEGLVVNYLELLWGAGGDVFDPSLERVLFNSTDAASTAAEFMRRAQENGFYAPGFNTMMEDQAKTAFAAGKAVFMRNWQSFYDFLQRPENSQVVGKFDIALLPVFAEGQNPSALGGSNLAVNKFSKKKELAKEFIRFASLNEDVQVSLGKSSQVPVLRSAYDQLQDDPVMKLLSQILPTAHTRPPVPSYNDISLTFQQEIFPAYTAQKPVPAALDAITGQLNRIIERRQQISGAR